MRTRGFSLIELLVVIAIILIILGMSIPYLKGAMENAEGVAAIKAITTIHTAQAQYQAQYGRLASTLSQLGPPSGGAPGASGAGLISAGLAAGQRGGYKFSLSATESGYAITRRLACLNEGGEAHVLFRRDPHRSPKLGL